MGGKVPWLEKKRGPCCFISLKVIWHRGWGWGEFERANTASLSDIDTSQVRLLQFCTRWLCWATHSHLIHKLQKVDNNTARLTCQTPKSHHIPPALDTHHWLPVEQRIECKLVLFAFKSVSNKGLSYPSDLLKFYIPSRQLHSSSDFHLLCIPSFHLKSFGQGKFLYQASVLWNSLLILLCHSNSTFAFKSALKMHLLPY